MLHRRRPISRDQMLSSVPLLNPAVRWEELDSGNLMAVFRKDRQGLRGLLMRLFHVPDLSQLALDELGSRVIRQIDGVKTVDALIAYVACEFKLNRKESEVSLVSYMEMLGRRNLIGFEIRPAMEGRASSNPPLDERRR